MTWYCTSLAAIVFCIGISSMILEILRWWRDDRRADERLQAYARRRESEQLRRRMRGRPWHLIMAYDGEHTHIIKWREASDAPEALLVLRRLYEEIENEGELTCSENLRN